MSIEGIPDLLSLTNYQPPTNQADATYVGTNAYIDNGLPKDIVIDSGQWKFTIARPAGDLSRQWKPKDDLIQYFDEQKMEFVQYSYSVDRLIYRAEDDELDVYITMKANSPALYLVYAAVVVVIGVVVSLTARSVLKSVEKVVDTGVQTVKQLETSPLVWGILALFLIPVLISGYKTVK